MSNPYDIAIIGAGVVGTAIASQLSKEGYSVILFEKESSFAQGGSGNPKALIMPYLTKNPHLESLYNDSLTMLSQECEQLGVEKKYAGVFQTLSSQRYKELYHSDCTFQFAQKYSRHKTESIIGIEIPQDGFYFPQAFVIDPRELCEKRLAISTAAILYSTSITKINYKNNHWNLFSSQTHQGSAKQLIIATAGDAAFFSQTEFLHLEKIRGQISYFASHEKSQKIKIPLSYDGYILPDEEGIHIVGSTYEHNEFTAEVTLKNELENHKRFSLCADMTLPMNTTPQGRTSFRASTYDRLPYIGKLRHQIPQKDVPIKYLTEEDFPLHPYLYVAAGFSSRGVSLSSLAAHLISDQIGDKNSHLRQKYEKLLSPSRVNLRKKVLLSS